MGSAKTPVKGKLRLTSTPGKSPAGKFVKRKLSGNRKLGNQKAGSLKQLFLPSSSIQVRPMTPKM